MKNERCSFLLLLSLFLLPAALSGQKTVAAAGGQAEGPGGSSAYSLGQVVYTTLEGQGGKISLGVQQVYEINRMPDVSVAHQSEVQWKLYPNPTEEQVMLHLDPLPEGSISYRLFDGAGRELARQAIVGTETRIPLTEYRAKRFVLGVYQDALQIDAFMIVKK